MITVFGGLFRLIVADKGCNAAACTRDSTHDRTNHRRDRHRFEAALDLCPRQLLMVQLQMLLTRCICTRIIIRAAEQFGNCEQTDQRNDQRDTGAQSTDTKGKPKRTADRILSQQCKENTDQAAEQTLDDIAVRDACNNRQAKHCDAEILRRAKHLCEMCNARCSKQQYQRTEQATEKRGIQRHRQSLQRLALLRQRITIQHSRCARGRTRCIDQNCSNGAAVCAAAIQAKQQKHRRDRFHTVCNRQAQDDRNIRSQTRNGTDNDTCQQTDENCNEAL